MPRWSHTPGPGPRTGRLRRPLLGAVLAAALAVAGCAGGGDDDPPPPATTPAIEAPADGAGAPYSVVEAVHGDGDPVVVATLGDSITAGQPLWSPQPSFRATIPGGGDPRSQYQHWAARDLPGTAYRNCGVGGELTGEIVRRLERCAQGADVLVVQGGSNDIFIGRSVAQVAAGVARLVRRGKALGLPVAVATVIPWNGGPAAAAAEIARLNAQIRTLAAQEDVLLLDWHSLLEDPERPGRMPPALTADGIHPSIAGYRRIGEALTLPR